MSKKKIAVVLFNLGGPDSQTAIKPFLYNFFMDPAIIPAPKPVRWALAKYISINRSKGEAGASYRALGGKSPLLDNTLAQARALEETLKEEAGKEYRCFVSMRYWHPMTEETVQQVKEYNPDQIVLLPLYPQFSTTTTGSSFQRWHEAAQKAGLTAPEAALCCYPMDSGFIRASAALVKECYEKALAQAAQDKTAPPRLLFSAHGLPESVIDGGDPYQWQCEKTAAAIVEEINIPALDWQICYQSRVGPKKWIEPSTEDALKKAAKDKVPVVVYPHAFVSEHVETLVELDIEYKELAKAAGAPAYYRVPTVAANRVFIDGLAALARHLSAAEGLYSYVSQRICPQRFGRCCMMESDMKKQQSRELNKI